MQIIFIKKKQEHRSNIQQFTPWHDLHPHTR